MKNAHERLLHEFCPPWGQQSIEVGCFARHHAVEIALWKDEPWCEVMLGAPDPKDTIDSF